MNPLLLGFVFLVAVAQCVLPRRFAFVPLILVAAHVGNAEILPQLSPARLVILLGIARAIAGGFFTWSKDCKLDVVVLAFSIVAVVSSFGHTPDEYFPSPFNARVGLVINVFGTYAYARAYLPDMDAFRRYALLVPLILIPLAFGMGIEQRTRKNVYTVLGARSSEAMTRIDRTRAQGPFRHPILAGTCGATALPFAFLMWKFNRRKLAVVGGIACIGVVLACASSGPLAAVATTFGAIALWRWRHMTKYLLWSGLALALLYNLFRGRGPWYLMASLDLVGGSTGWHRAKLIDQGFKYLNEWWLWGTDYTRHWMASGVRWNPNMVDLTNYYLHLGVTGGIGLTLCLIAFIVISFRMLARRMNALRESGDPNELVLWCAGASLAAHAISFVSISYFDQMYVYFYLLVGAIPGITAVSKSHPQNREEPSRNALDSMSTAEPEPQSV